jgi:topoisomerase-4 subunit A
MRVPGTLLKYVPGPDFPTGGLIVDPRNEIAEAYATGRGSFRVRARWTQEDSGRGTWLVVITEIPWLVQKMRLVERIAELINEKKLPLVADVRDESAEDIRLVIEPRARTVDPALMMESLFKLTELESRIPLNMNVLIKGKVPKVIGLAEALREWLDHRRDVLLRRSNHRLKQISHRLEVLGGYLIAYLNLDRVIKIIRTEDEPKPVLMKAFKLTDVQAEAILNMRLRNLRKLEEMEIRKEDKELRVEKKTLEELVKSEKQQWETIAAQIKGAAREVRPQDADRQAAHRFRRGARARRGLRSKKATMIREPVTIVVSEKGWVRALRGHLEDLSNIAFKQDDKLKLSVLRRDDLEAADARDQRALLHHRRHRSCRAGAATASRCASSPTWSRKPTSSPMFPFQGGRKFIVASHQGRGFIVAEEECLGTTRKGKQILNVKAPDEARAVATVEGEQVASIGDNRKLLIFPLEQLPEMARGSGVRLQRYKDGGLSDVKTFKGAEGLTWTDAAGRGFSLTLKELSDWRGNRADAGRLPPKGFPRSNRFK